MSVKVFSGDRSKAVEGVSENVNGNVSESGKEITGIEQK